MFNLLDTLSCARTWNGLPQHVISASSLRFAVIPMTVNDNNDNNDNKKWSKTFDERLHCHLVTPRGGEWIRPTLIQSNTWFFGPHEFAPKRHLDRFSRFAQLTTVTNRQTDTCDICLCIDAERAMRPEKIEKAPK